jgi:hypothetical protein
MKRLEDAARRLEEAVARLEKVAGRLPSTHIAETRRLTAALAEAKAEQAALEETTTHVASRLDAAIGRLNAVLGP